MHRAEWRPGTQDVKSFRNKSFRNKIAEAEGDVNQEHMTVFYPLVWFAMVCAMVWQYAGEWRSTAGA